MGAVRLQAGILQLLRLCRGAAPAVDRDTRATCGGLCARRVDTWRIHCSPQRRARVAGSVLPGHWLGGIRADRQSVSACAPKRPAVGGGAGSVTPGRGGEDEAATQFPEQVELAPPSAPLPFRLTPAGRALFTSLPILLALAALVWAYRMRVWTRVPAYVAHNIEASGGLVPAWLGRWVHWFELDPLERLFASVRWTLRLLGRPQPPHATPAMQAAALSSALPSARKHAEILRAELETSLFTDDPADIRRARTASFWVLVEGLRAHLNTSLTTSNGSAVYSEPDFTDKPRGTR